MALKSAWPEANVLLKIDPPCLVCPSDCWDRPCPAQLGHGREIKGQWWAGKQERRVPRDGPRSYNQTARGKGTLREKGKWSA